MPFETSVAQPQPAGYETPLLALALPRGPLPPSLAGAGQADRRRHRPGACHPAISPASGMRPPFSIPPAPASRVLLVGLGKPEEIDRTAIRRAAAIAAKRARSLGVPRAAFSSAARSPGQGEPAAVGPGDRGGAQPGRMAVQRDEEAGGREEAPARADGDPGATTVPRS